jgi:hypothetical protein
VGAAARIAVALVLALLHAAAAQSGSAQSSVQHCLDRRCTLVNKDVGNERWAIQYNLEDGTVTGNVFFSDGRNPAFVWCSTQAESADEITFSCYGTDRCAVAPCRASGWAFIAEIALPLTFLVPPESSATPTPHATPSVTPPATGTPRTATPSVSPTATPTRTPSPSPPPTSTQVPTPTPVSPESITLLGPGNGTTVGLEVTFTWRVDNERPGTTYCSELITDKGDDPFDGGFENSFDVGTARTRTIDFATVCFGCYANESFWWGVRVTACNGGDTSCPCAGRELESDEWGLTTVVD